MINLTRFAQKRPIVIWIIVIFIVIIGLISYFSMPMMMLPQIKVPGAVIETEVSGGSASQVDQNVTRPLLRNLKSLGQVSTLVGTSYPGISVIMIEFPIGTGALQAFQNVVTQVNRTSLTLPKSVTMPSVTQLNLTNVPIMTLAVSSKFRSLTDLTEFAEDNIINRLIDIPGVEKVDVSGGRTRAVEVYLDPIKMSGYGVDIQQVGKAFKSENIEFPGYFVNTQNKAFLLNLNEKFKKLSDVRNLIVKMHEGNVVHLSQIATVTYGAESSRAAVIYNGKPAIGLVVSKVANQNSIKVIDRVEKFMHNTLIPNLPKDIYISIARNNAHAIKRNVNSLEMTVLYAIFFASLIVFAFIRSLRSLFIIVIAIPISLLMGIIMLRLVGGSFNIITLLSLVLLVGLVVDDAIVVTENVHRVRQLNPQLSPADGTLKGVNQVTFAVLASTITLLAIFCSSVVMKSDIAVIFQAFSVAILAGVTTSYFVSMTVTPLLAQEFMKVGEVKNRFYEFLERSVNGYVKAYNKILPYVLKWRYLVVILMIAYMVPSLFVLKNMGNGFFAEHADHAALKINIRGPSGATLSYTQAILDDIHKNLTPIPQIKSSYATIGPIQSNIATVYLNLKPMSETGVDSEIVLEHVQHAIADVSGAIFTVTPVPESAVFAQPLDFSVSDVNYDQLMKNIIPFAVALDEHPELGSISSDLEPDVVQYQLKINRQLASSRGISAEDIMESVSLFGGHIKVGSITPQSFHPRRYNIYLEPKKNSLINTSDLEKIYLFGKGKSIQLSTIASIKKVLLPSVIHRNNMEYSINFSGTPKIATNYALEKIRTIGAKIFPKSTHIVAGGQASASKVAMHSTIMGLGFSFLILYFILTIQFESFLQPLVVLASEPLALVGAIYVLAVCNFTLNIFSLIGMLLLMGLVAKNAILLVSRTNQYRAQNMDLIDALGKACPERLVPITMTSLTIILAMIPVFTHSGVGAKNQIVLAATIVAGIVASTILSVIFVPAFYAILEHIKQKLGARFFAKSA